MLAVRAGILDSSSEGGTAADQLETADKSRTLEEQETGQAGSPGLWRSPAFWAVATLALLVILILIVFQRTRLLEDNPNGSSNVSSLPAENRMRARQPLPSKTASLAAVAFENSIYVFGGESEDGTTAESFRYDLESDSWTALSDKPTASKDNQAAVLGGRVYVAGGTLPTGQVTPVLEIYDPSSDKWESGPSMPAGLSRYAIVAYEGRLYLFGGWDGSQFTTQVLAFDPDSGEWASLTPMETPLGDAGAVVASDRIHLIGGFDGTRALDTNWIYTPAREGDGPWQPAAPLPDARHAFGLVSVADSIHLIGGIRQPGNKLNHLEYSPQSDAWQPVDNPFLEERSALQAVHIGTQFYFIGGRLDGVLTDLNHEYQAIYLIAIPIVR